MNKFGIILAHTYLSRLKSKQFIITTVITLLLIVGLTNFQTVIDDLGGGDSEDGNRQVALIGDASDVIDPLQQNLEMMEANVDLETFDGSEEEAKQAVIEGEYAALVNVEIDDQGLPSGTYYAEQVANSGLSNQLREGLQQVKRTIATENAGVDAAVLQQIAAPIAFEAIPLEESAKTEEELSEARGLVYVMLFLLYFTVLLYGTMIAMEVATEKSSRVMEILISSASPVTQMFAKIMGVALVGVTQITLFILVGYQSVKMNMDTMTGGIFEYFGLSGIDASTLVYVLVFFLLGYLLYATLAAMLGSLVTRIEDVQQMIMPMTLLIVAAFMIAMFGLGTPDSTFVTITSFIPFFTPMLMFLRVGMLDVPMWEVGLSIGLMIGTILLLGIIGARIYRGGVLMYGKSTSLKDIRKAMQLSKKES
ncbi:ABC transporter permease [Thalassobacillus hwangdonensis]|uniref:ABC transporter permease n=1 Tax=Thalassobacillus hwangdonensis TaxID=546108 RepID=A0ABW3KW42_9BACI